MALLALALALAAPPNGDAPLSAEELSRRSTIEYNLGDFQSAFDDASASYKLTPKPGLLFNLGQIQRELRHWQQAEFYYGGYLREKPDADNREAVQDLIRDMVVRQEAERTSTPVVSVPPEPQTDLAAVPLAPAPPPSGPSGIARNDQPSRSHAVSYALAGLSASGVVLLGMSIGVVADYQSYRNSVGNRSLSVSYADFQGHANTAQVFSALLFVGAGLALAGAAGAILTW